MKYVFSLLDINKKNDYLSKLSRKTVVIFGASHVGMIVLYALKKKSIEITCFCDNKMEKQNTFFCGVPVISVEDLAKLHPGASVFISSIQFDGIASQLMDKGYTDIYNCVDLLQGLEIEGNFPISFELLTRALDTYMLVFLSKYRKNFLSIHSLDLVVTEKCSLKCKDCANLMQYYEKPKDSDEKMLIEALHRIFQAVDYVHEFRVIGGEPFMYNNLRSILYHLSTLSKYSRILIYTNGTMVPNNDLFCGYDTANVEVIIADYGDLSKKIVQLKEKLTVQKICYDVVKFDKWMDCAVIKYHDRTEDELKFLYYNCCAKTTFTLLHGKLYSCPFSANAYNLRAIPSQPNGWQDGIDCLNNNVKIDELKARIKKLYLETDYIHACKYCNGRDYSVTEIPSAIQTKSCIPYERLC